MSFAKVLRAVLRQDPDIILIGEMRDQETAEIGLRAAVTGHLVLSTLHTNDSLSAAVRLSDMGAEPYLLASGLRGVISQRLVRRICSSCGEDYQPDEQEMSWLNKFVDHQDVTAWRHGKGCVQCHNTGYRGRAAIFEILIPDLTMLEAIRKRSYGEFVKLANASETFTPLSTSAISLAKQGITSLEEVLRVCESIEDISEHQ